MVRKGLLKVCTDLPALKSPFKGDLEGRFPISFQYITGRIVTVRGRVKIVPKQMTTPIGIQRLVCAIIIGMTPSAVVAEVRKIGRIRRKPAS